MNAFGMAAGRILAPLGRVFYPVMRQALGNIIGQVMHRGIEHLGKVSQDFQKNQFSRQSLEDFKRGFKKDMQRAGLDVTQIARNTLKRTSNDMIDGLAGQLTKKIFK